MKFSERWLRTWVNPSVTSAELVDQLTMAGLEVDAVTPLGIGLEKVVVGEVLTVIQHPNADRLRVCAVRISHENEPLTIVCGAPNVREGLKVALATIGAVLPGNITIKQAKIRGVESFGMLCSRTELGIGESSDGIIELPADAPVGQSINEYMQFPDQIIDVNLTPNRGDCLSILGVAREVALLTKTFMKPLTSSFPETGSQTVEEAEFPIIVSAPEDCPRYIGRVLRGINPKATTPLWLQERLRRSGIRSIHPVVDAANYVMLELGQPMHAFDLSVIKEKIEVRRSHPGEQVTVLDGQTVHFQEPALVIADAQKILAVAGVMGGAGSAVTTETTDLFLESAFFSPQTIRSTLRRYPLQSDSSHRYERGVDPQLPLKAIHRLTTLLVEMVGGDPGPVVEVTNDDYLPKPQPLLLRHERIQRVLGVAIERSVVEELLQSLGMQISSHSQGWQVLPPSYRFDLAIEADLIEELARVYGYNRIPDGAITAALAMLPVGENQLTQARMRHYFMDQGYTEVINYSFIAPELSRQIDPIHTAIPLKNPISADMAVMRTSLWPGLLQTALFNLNRQRNHLRLFEVGVCFTSDTTSVVEEAKIAGLALGPVQPEQWSGSSRMLDFFDLKGDLEGLLNLTNARDRVTWVPSRLPSLHPGRAAEIQLAGKPIGNMGQLHPLLVRDLGFPGEVYLFELSLAGISQTLIPVYDPPSKFPSVRRDLSFVVDERVSYQDICEKIRVCAKDALQGLQLFDVYQGEKIPKGQKSMAIGLTFQLASRTLVDQEVDEMITVVVNTLKRDFSANLRE